MNINEKIDIEPVFDKATNIITRILRDGSKRVVDHDAKTITTEYPDGTKIVLDQNTGIQTTTHKDGTQTELPFDPYTLPIKLSIKDISASNFPIR